MSCPGSRIEKLIAILVRPQSHDPVDLAMRIGHQAHGKQVGAPPHRHHPSCSMGGCPDESGEGHSRKSVAQGLAHQHNPRVQRHNGDAIKDFKW
jgi:hypothetical protein